MIKYIYLVLITFFISGCSSSSLILKSDFEKDTDTIFEKTFDYCTVDSYKSLSNTKEYGKLFTEYIDLDISCTWNGFSRGFFETLFQDSLKVKSMKTIERFDYDNYEFSTYLINGEYYMNLIYEFNTFEDKFIIDYDGMYFTKEIKKFNPNYENKYLTEKRFSSNYFESLVDKNFINNYFHKESESLNILGD